MYFCQDYAENLRTWENSVTLFLNIYCDYFISCAVDIVNRPRVGQLRNWSPIPERGKKFISPPKLPACLKSQTKTNQKELRVETFTRRKSTSFGLLAIPAFDRIAVLSNRHVIL
jgi:hypothetical protein